LKVLYVCYYSPIKSVEPRAIRARYLTLNLLKRGHHVSVFTVDSDAKTRFQGLNIYGATSVSNWYKDAHLCHNTRLSLSPKYKLIDRLKYYIRLLLFPDAKVGWFIFSILNFRKVLREEKPHIVITSALPFTGTLFGMLAKFIDRRITWIVDLGDPFSFNYDYFPFWRKQIDEKIEALVLAKCDGLVVTTCALMAEYSKRYPQMRGKIAVVRQGYDKNEYDYIKPRTLRGKFTFFYSGSFHREIREPFAFLEAVKVLISKYVSASHVQIIICGKFFREVEDYIKKEGLTRVVTLLGVLPHSEVVSWQKGADVNVLLGNSSLYQIPSKLFEYIAAGKPILYIKMNENDEISNIIEESVNIGLTVANEPDKIARAMCSLIKNKNIGTRGIREVNKYEWSNLTKEFEMFITQIAYRKLEGIVQTYESNSQNQSTLS